MPDFDVLLVEDFAAVFLATFVEPFEDGFLTAFSSVSEELETAFGLALEEPLGLPLCTGRAGLSCSSSELIETSGVALALVDPFVLPLFTGGASSSSSELSDTLITAAFLFAGA